jgi:hypothetical protein
MLLLPWPVSLAVALYGGTPANCSPACILPCTGLPSLSCVASHCLALHCVAFQALPRVHARLVEVETSTTLPQEEPLASGHSAARGSAAGSQPQQPPQQQQRQQQQPRAPPGLRQEVIDRADVLTPEAFVAAWVNHARAFR